MVVSLEKTVVFRINKKTFDSFSGICTGAGLTPSQIMRSFVEDCLKDNALITRSINKKIPGYQKKAGN